MFYKLINIFIEKRILKLRKISYSLLEDNLNLWLNLLKSKNSADLDFISGGSDVHENILLIKNRMNLFKEYSSLISNFEFDSRRRFLININFLKFLKAIKFLYSNDYFVLQNNNSNYPQQIAEIEKSFKSLIYLSHIKE